MFREELERTIGKVLNDNDYKMVVNSQSNIFFIKRYSKELAFYISCNDRRDDSNGIAIEMYFTAIQIPDDRIKSFNAGLNIEILTIYFDITDEILRAAGEKVVAIEKNIGVVDEVIMDELEEPYFPIDAEAAFRENKLIYEIINSNKNLQEELVILKGKVCKVINNKENVFSLSSDFINNLSTDFFDEEKLRIGMNKIKKCFAEQVYAQCILDA